MIASSFAVTRRSNRTRLTTPPAAASASRGGGVYSVVGHSVVVLCLRYLIEHMTEEQILRIDRENEVANCSVTSYRYDETASPRGKLRLELFNFVAPLEEAGAPVTSEPDASVAAK